MDADLDTLVTALYVQVDDLLKANPDRVPWRPLVGIAPRISDAELVTLAVAQALLGFTSEARWLRFGRTHLRELFPYLPGQPGYNKRLRKLVGTLSWLIRALETRTSMFGDDVWIADSTPVECGRSRETAKRSDMAGLAEYGYWWWPPRWHRRGWLVHYPPLLGLCSHPVTPSPSFLADTTTEPLPFAEAFCSIVATDPDPLALTLTEVTTAVWPSLGWFVDAAKLRMSPGVGKLAPELLTLMSALPV